MQSKSVWCCSNLDVSNGPWPGHSSLVTASATFRLSTRTPALPLLRCATPPFLPEQEQHRIELLTSKTSSDAI